MQDAAAMISTFHTIPVTFIDNNDAFKECAEELHSETMKEETTLYVDLVGNLLSGTPYVSILVLFLSDQPIVYLLDVDKLGNKVFEDTTDGRSLRRILEDPSCSKAFFKIRRPSAFLFSRYGIRLAGCIDVQLMESSTRAFPGLVLRSLATCVRTDAGLSAEERERLDVAMNKANRLLKPALGGSHDRIKERPLTTEIEFYCIQAVIFVSRLRLIYQRKMIQQILDKTEDATDEFIEKSCSPDFDPMATEGLASAPDWSKGPPVL